MIYIVIKNLYYMGVRPDLAGFERNLKKALESGGTELLNVVDQLLAPKPILRVGDTTTTAYRRVHEILGSVLDFVIRAATEITETTENQRKAEIANRLAIELSRAKVIVNYQLARDQISQDIAMVLNHVLDSISNALRRGQREAVRELAERGRALIDALAVFVYRHGRTR